MFENLSGHPTRFSFSVQRLVVTNASAFRIGRPEVLALALKIVFYDRARDVENRLRRAIVLFEPNRFRIWKMLFEVENVADVGAAPLVDRLIFITDDRDVLLLFSQMTNQRELQRVGVLVFVDEDVAKLVVVLLSDFCNVAQQAH